MNAPTVAPASSSRAFLSGFASPLRGRKSDSSDNVAAPGASQTPSRDSTPSSSGSSSLTSSRSVTPLQRSRSASRSPPKAASEIEETMRFRPGRMAVVAAAAAAAITPALPTEARAELSPSNLEWIAKISSDPNLEKLTRVLIIIRRSILDKEAERAKKCYHDLIAHQSHDRYYIALLQREIEQELRNAEVVARTLAGPKSDLTQLKNQRDALDMELKGLTASADPSDRIHRVRLQSERCQKLYRRALSEAYKKVTERLRLFYHISLDDQLIFDERQTNGVRKDFLSLKPVIISKIVDWVYRHCYKDLTSHPKYGRTFASLPNETAIKHLMEKILFEESSDGYFCEAEYQRPSDIGIKGQETQYFDGFFVLRYLKDALHRGRDDLLNAASEKQEHDPHLRGVSRLLNLSELNSNLNSIYSQALSIFATCCEYTPSETPYTPPVIPREAPPLGVLEAREETIYIKYMSFPTLPLADLLVSQTPQPLTPELAMEWTTLNPAHPHQKLSLDLSKISQIGPGERDAIWHKINCYKVVSRSLVGNIRLHFLSEISTAAAAAPTKDSRTIELQKHLDEVERVFNAQCVAIEMLFPQDV